MIKYLSFLIFKLIILIDGFLFLLFKKNIKYKIYDFLRECAYIEEKILDKKVIFFAPSSNSRERVKKILTKEPDTINWIKNFNKFEIDKPIFWDIGSNIGLFSIFASVCHENLKVISFEPSTNNLALLSRNISIYLYTILSLRCVCSFAINPSMHQSINPSHWPRPGGMCEAIE